MKKKIVLFVIFFISIIFSSSLVSARETLDFATVSYVGEGNVGSITIYDDYVIRIGYKYSASNVKIDICPKSDCNNLTTQTYESNETYFDGEYVDFYISEHFSLYDGSEYKVSITASFKPYAAAITDVSAGFIETDIEYIAEKAVDRETDPYNKYADAALTDIEKVAKVFRDYIIPFLYVILVIVLIIKGILLGMDITKYSDQPDIRREKIRGFTYFGVAIFLLAILNTIGGFVTGLFG